MWNRQSSRNALVRITFEANDSHFRTLPVTSMTAVPPMPTVTDMPPTHAIGIVPVDPSVPIEQVVPN